MRDLYSVSFKINVICEFAKFDVVCCKLVYLWIIRTESYNMNDWKLEAQAVVKIEPDMLVMFLTDVLLFLGRGYIYGEP